MEIRALLNIRKSRVKSALIIPKKAILQSRACLLAPSRLRSAATHFASFSKHLSIIVCFQVSHAACTQSNNQQTFLSSSRDPGENFDHFTYISCTPFDYDPTQSLRDTGQQVSGDCADVTARLVLPPYPPRSRYLCP